ncbi:hypothetical protein [Kitasatospora azatica]|uniref:hypothetical protein n=1 Tax=Kitasatospora azatica TaxID=58347 RepID=UPI000AA578C9|nr:hypothetical protein [Kitasatospora azatica]
MARWIFPPEVTGPEPAEPDPGDYCPNCGGTAIDSIDDCRCADLVTPRPHQL